VLLAVIEYGLHAQIMCSCCNDWGSIINGGILQAYNSQLSEFEMGLDVEPAQAEEFHLHDHHVYALLINILLYLII
jgi:hypothetical protein